MSTRRSGIEEEFQKSTSNLELIHCTFCSQHLDNLVGILDRSLLGVQYSSIHRGPTEHTTHNTVAVMDYENRSPTVKIPCCTAAPRGSRISRRGSDQ
jgi:hypothetical protein